MRTKVSLSLAFFAAAVLAAGCTAADDDLGSKSDDVDQPGDDDDDDDDECECKIEGAAIGVVGYVVHVDGETYVFEDWIPKPDSPGEFVGFVLSENAGSLSYVVKAGTNSYPGSGVEWMHPAGEDNPDANGISNVDLCVDEEPIDIE
jgi:hypothetical protein